MKPLAMLLAAGAMLAGCSLTGPQPEQRYFVLDSGLAPAAATATAIGPAAPAKHRSTLLVAPTSAGAFYESQDIVFARGAGTRSRYQYRSSTRSSPSGRG